MKLNGTNFKFAPVSAYLCEQKTASFSVLARNFGQDVAFRVNPIGGCSIPPFFSPKNQRLKIIPTGTFSKDFFSQGAVH